MLRCIGPWFHEWSRPFHDPVKKESYNRCVVCGARRRSDVQYTYVDARRTQLAATLPPDAMEKMLED